MQQVRLSADSILMNSYPGDKITGMPKNDTVVMSSDSVGSDTIIAPVRTREIPSLFQGHELKVKEFNFNKNPGGNEDWIAVHFIIGLIVFAWVRIFYAKRLKQVFKSLYGIRFQGMLEREGNIFKERISIALVVIYLISTSLLLYLFFTRIYPVNFFGLTSFKLFSLLMLFVIVGWILKSLINAFIGIVFNNPVVVSVYSLTNFIFNITIGSILFPVLIFAVYMPSNKMVYAGVIIWAISFIYRVIRLAVTGLSFTKFSLFNRFLYLCTFEIIPILVLIKLTMSYLG